MASSTQKPEGRAFADNIRQPEEMKNALVWLFDTDASQLTGFLRSGPAAGRAKLLLACSRAVCEPPNPAPASSDGPPVAPTSSAPVASADAATSFGDTKDVKESTSDEPAASVATGAAPDIAAASVASAGDDAVSATTPDPSHPPGAPTPATTTSDPVGPSATEDASQAPVGPPAPSDGTSPAPSRFDHVAPPTFVDTSEIPRRAKVSTRQVLCCRETCSICFQACCGYSSELPHDSHFAASDVHHRCKACYRASRNKATEATPSTQATFATSQDTHDPWHHTSQDSSGSWQHSPGWSSGHWEWDSWNGQWMWH